MENTLEKIQSLKLLIKDSKRQYLQAVEQLNSEKKKHQQIIVDKQRLENEVLELTEQVKTIKLAQAIQGNNDQSSRELKNQINRYIREIDKCLQLINND